MKPIPYGMTFEQALRAGYVGRIEDEKYLAFVRKLPCCCCGKPGEVAHHPIQIGFGGKSTKAPDYWAIPMTAGCHSLLHFDIGTWEALNGSQEKHAMLTLTRYMLEGE